MSGTVCQGYLGGQNFDGTVANQCWDFYKAFVELDKLSKDRKGEDGNELDQFWSAKFLEDNDKGAKKTPSFPVTFG